MKPEPEDPRATLKALGSLAFIGLVICAILTRHPLVILPLVLIILVGAPIVIVLSIRDARRKKEESDRLQRSCIERKVAQGQSLLEVTERVPRRGWLLSWAPGVFLLIVAVISGLWAGWLVGLFFVSQGLLVWGLAVLFLRPWPRKKGIRPNQDHEVVEQEGAVQTSPIPKRTITSSTDRLPDHIYSAWQNYRVCKWVVLVAIGFCLFGSSTMSIHQIIDYFQGKCSLDEAALTLPRMFAFGISVTSPAWIIALLVGGLLRWKIRRWERLNGAGRE